MTVVHGASNFLWNVDTCTENFTALTTQTTVIIILKREKFRNENLNFINKSSFQRWKFMSNGTLWKMWSRLLKHICPQGSFQPCMICVWVIMDITQTFRMKMALICAALNTAGCLKKKIIFFHKRLVTPNVNLGYHQNLAICVTFP